VAQAHLPALMPALACLTGDLSAIDRAWQPDMADQAQRPRPQAGLSEQAQQLARHKAHALITRWHQEGRKAAPALPAAQLQTALAFITGRVDPSVLDLLLHELGRARPVGQDGPPRLGLPPDFRVVVVGAGMSGLVASWHLSRLGIAHTVLERQPEIGGVWVENTYPGCRLDTSNFCYSYSFHQQARWRHHFSPRDEVLRYLEEVARSHGIDRRIQWRTHVVGLAYDDATKRWHLELARDGRREQVQADAVISAVGQLNEPRLPQIPGLERYTGHTWHTARWNHEVALDGLRVGVIGTGASAFQVVPQIAPRVQSLRVFQRTPPWVVRTPSYTRELPEGLRWLLEHLPGYNAWYREQFWVAVEGRRRYSIVDPTWTRPGSVSALNQQLREMLEQDIRASYPGRPDLQRLMTPGYPPYAKRMLRDDGAWPAALMRDNVRVVTAPISEFTPTGVRCADGSAHELDAVIFGTGFRASEFLSSMQVTGRAGADLHAQWGGEPQAYRGICVPGFPNLFLLYGPNTNLITNGSLVLFGEFEVEFVMRCLKTLAVKGARAMEPTFEAAQADAQRVAAAARGMAYGIDGVRNWYKAASGRVTQNWPFGTVEFWRQTRDVRVEDFTFHR